MPPHLAIKFIMSGDLWSTLCTVKYGSAAGRFVFVGSDRLALHFHLVHFCTPAPFIMTHQDSLLGNSLDGCMKDSTYAPT